jgi:hypothetical protein
MQTTTKIFNSNEIVSIKNVTPEGIVLDFFLADNGVGICSFATGEVTMLTDKRYMDVFVAGSKIFGYNIDEEAYVLLN